LTSIFVSSRFEFRFPFTETLAFGTESTVANFQDYQNWHNLMVSLRWSDGKGQVSYL